MLIPASKIAGAGISISGQFLGLHENIAGASVTISD